MGKVCTMEFLNKADTQKHIDNKKPLKYSKCTDFYCIRVVIHRPHPVFQTSFPRRGKELNLWHNRHLPPLGESRAKARKGGFKKNMFIIN